MTNKSLSKPAYTFPSLNSQWSRAIEKDTRKWINQDFHFIPAKMRLKYQLSNFGKISARCLPEMNSYAHLQAAAKFMLWGTIFDDYYEFKNRQELTELHHQVMDVLAGGSPLPSASPFMDILFALRTDLVKLMSQAWLNRFSANVSVWISSMQEEVPYKEPDEIQVPSSSFTAFLFSFGENLIHLLPKQWLIRLTTNLSLWFNSLQKEEPSKGILAFPKLDYFMELRERTIGVQAYLDLIEMQLPSCLPDWIMKSSYIKEVYRLAARIFAWCNDFYSILKDIGREPLNLVLVIQHQDNLTLERAHRRAMEIHDRDVEQLTALMHEIPDFGANTPLVRRFIYLLGVMIQGQNQWYQIDTPRYHHNGYPVKGSFDQAVTV